MFLIGKEKVYGKRGVRICGRMDLFEDKKREKVGSGRRDW